MTLSRQGLMAKKEQVWWGPHRGLTRYLGDQDHGGEEGRECLGDGGTMKSP